MDINELAGRLDGIILQLHDLETELAVLGATVNITLTIRTGGQVQEISFPIHQYTSASDEVLGAILRQIEAQSNRKNQA